MKIVVRVELITDWGEVNTIEVGRIDRPSQTLDPESVGLSLADGKQLLHNLQQAVIPAQADEFCGLRRICRRCHRWTALKDYRRRKVDTVFPPFVTTGIDASEIRTLGRAFLDFGSVGSFNFSAWLISNLFS
jgi:hypothetical protein